MINLDPNINFSIVMPAHRWEWIEVSVNSIFETATNPSSIEVHIAIDNDDRQSMFACKRLYRTLSNVFIHLTQRNQFKRADRDFVGIVPYINYLAFNYAKGKYVMPFNDDALFIKANWDIEAHRKLEEFASKTNNRTVLGRTEDFMIHPHGYLGSKAPISSFPFISREGIEHYRFLFSPEFYHNTADGHITHEYWKRGRLVDLRDCVHIAHRPERLMKWSFLKEEKYKGIKQQMLDLGREEAKIQ